MWSSYRSCGVSAHVSASCTNPRRILYTKKNISEFYNAVKPGDRLQFLRGYYSHFAIYIGDFKGAMHCLIELNAYENASVFGYMFASAAKKLVSGSEMQNAGKMTGKIEISLVEEVLEIEGGGSVCINNTMDAKHTPRSQDEILEEAIEAYENQPDSGTDYNLFESNCEHFANSLRYGVVTSEQVTDTAVEVGAMGALGAAAVAAMAVVGALSNK